MSKVSKVKGVLGGYYRKWKQSTNVDENQCPFCKIEMKDFADLYEEPNPDICTEWSQKKHSMEARFYECSQCNKTFVYWETLDYDYFHLQEVTISGRNQNMTSQNQTPQVKTTIPKTPKKSKANAMPKANPMPNPMPNPPMIPMGQNGIGSAICSRCGHSFKPTKPLKECPECGLTVAEEIDGELEWTEEMQEPIPQFVYNSQSPEEIFYKSIRWYYLKWIAKLKGNPSSRIK